MSASGVYGGRPTSHIDLEVGGQLVLGVMPNRAHTSSTVGPSWAAIHGTMARSRCSRSPDGSAAVTCTASSQADEVVAQLGRLEHLGVVEEATARTSGRRPGW